MPLLDIHPFVFTAAAQPASAFGAGPPVPFHMANSTPHDFALVFRLKNCAACLRALPTLLVHPLVVSVFCSNVADEYRGIVDSSCGMPSQTDAREDWDSPAKVLELRALYATEGASSR